MKEKLYVNEVQENLYRIEERIQKACDESHRSRNDITLMGVSKTFDADRVNLAIDAGIHLLGENRVQEILQKKPLLNMENVQMHLIGHLQSNKVKSIVGKVDMIQSVDSLKIASAIDKASNDLGICTDVLLEVNVGKEENKTGFYYEQLMDSIYEVSELKNIHICGLMCVPPICDKKTEISKYFYNLNKVFLDIRQKKLDNVDMKILSMGMSSDFEEAIKEGSTMVRIGTLLFGGRTYPQK